MRRRLVIRVAGSVIAAVGTVAALTMPAVAAPTAIPLDPGLLHAMQRDLGLSAPEAKQRLAQEATANEADATLRDTLGAAFGGSYFDAAAGHLVVGVLDVSRADAVRAAGAQPVRVDDSERDLDAAADTLSRHAEAASDAVTGWYVDSAANQVVVTTAVGSAAQAHEFVHESGVDASRVDVVESSETPRTFANVYGGDAYYMGSGGRCSVGFAVNGGFVTAGHCGRTGTSTSQPTGSFAGSSFPGDDYAFVRVGSGDVTQPLVNMYDGYGRAVSGSQAAAVGASVCRSGSTTGWHCGSIQSKNQTVNYAEGSVYGLTRTNVCAEPGDSGGSFISGNQAQGMTSGGSGNCTSGGTTYFQPVNEVLNRYGLTLKTR